MDLDSGTVVTDGYELPSPPTRPNLWRPLAIVTGLLVLASVLFTGGNRLERNEAPLPGFEVQTTPTTAPFDGDLTRDWYGGRLDSWGALTALATDGSRIIAVEQSPYGSRLWRSDDAEVWVVVDTVDLLDSAQLEHLSKVSWGWVAAGSDGDRQFGGSPSLWFSDDGLSWTPASRIELPPAVGFGEAAGPGTINCVLEQADGALLACGFANNGGMVWRSVDQGRTWSTVFREGLYSEIHHLIDTGKGLLAIGEISLRATTWSSDDGITWTRDEPPALTALQRNEVPVGVAMGDDGWLVWSMAYGNRRTDFERVETSDRRPVIWQTDDGAAWERDLIDDLLGYEFRSVVAFGPGFVAVSEIETSEAGRSPVLWSEDGHRWEQGGALAGDGDDRLLMSLVPFRDTLVAAGRWDGGPAVWVWSPNRALEVVSNSAPVWPSGNWVDHGRVLDESAWQVAAVEEGLVTQWAGGLALSQDGLTWERLTFEDLGLTGAEWFVTLPTGVPPYWTAVAEHNGESWSVARSENGRSWEIVWTDDSEDWGWGRVAANDQRVLRSMDDGVFVSQSGHEWTAVELPTEGTPTSTHGFRDLFLVVIGNQFNGDGVLWILTRDNEWVDSGIVLRGSAWDLGFIEHMGELIIYEPWGEEQGAWTSSDGLSWSPTELPSAGDNLNFRLASTQTHLVVAATIWTEEDPWPSRIWVDNDEGGWDELPPLAYRGYETIPLPTIGPIRILIGDNTGTRLFEWVPEVP